MIWILSPQSYHNLINVLGMDVKKMGVKNVDVVKKSGIVGKNAKFQIGRCGIEMNVYRNLVNFTYFY